MTYALLDDGSTVTLLDKLLSDKLQLKGTQFELSMTTANGQMIVPNCKKVDFLVASEFGEFYIQNAIAVNNIKLPNQTVSADLLEKLRIPSKVQIEPYYSAQVQLLIGMDNWELLRTSELIEIENSDLALSCTPMGWALHGRSSCAQNSRTTTKSNLTHVMTLVSEPETAHSRRRRAISFDQDTALDRLMREYFVFDAAGVEGPSTQKPEFNRALHILKESTRRVGNTWETGLLWKSDVPPCVDSYHTARKRLFMLENRLDRNPEFATYYYREMQRFISSGYAKKIDRSVVRPRYWYLPHFGVYNVNKPGKVRPVFDCAAKSVGVSLNDQLDPGPDLLRPLPGVLLRFRQYLYAIKGDISDMFLRVSVRECDRGAQRFLWRGDRREGEPDIYEMGCLIFGSSSSPSSANFVKNKNADEFSASKPLASKCIKKNSYMDDALSSCKTEYDALSLMEDVIEVNAAGNFEMHGWASNSRLVSKEIAKTEPPNPDREMRLCDRGGERVLGLFWDIESDTLKFNLSLAKIPQKILDGTDKPTKREVLRVIMSIFDPLGLIAPFTLQSKILMQEIWRSGILWDEKLKDEEHAAWLTWFARIDSVKKCSLPRCLTPKHDQHAKAQLHVFCDASLCAYAASAYLRFESPDGQIHISLLTAKTKVAPIKPASLDIVKLELQAAILGARLSKFVKEELEIEISSRVFWTDNVAVLYWIKSEPRARQVFVANRLGEIGKLTSQSEWRWVPSKENPADEATRFDTPALREGSMWFNGPAFLLKTEENWPVQTVLSPEEKLRYDAIHSRKVFMTSTTIETPKRIAPLFACLLGWEGLLIFARRIRRALVQWKHFTHSLRDHHASDSLCERGQKNEPPEYYWYRVIQAARFPDELESLKKRSGVSAKNKLAPYCPFLDENQIMRANGRVLSAPPDEFENFPIILHAKHKATKFLIMHYHRKLLHCSHDTVLNEIRQKYYIIGLRHELRVLASRCIVCRVRRGSPQSPAMAALPAGRTAYRQRPFSHCGVDYFGPMWVKIGRRREKRWGVLFTCLTTRAVYLDFAESLSADSAILAVIRLARIRGTPSVMYSDNGTNFRAAEKELKSEFEKMNQSEMLSKAKLRKIEWRFNPPDAPHMGGAWERLVRSVKIALDAILNDQAPKPEVLQTTLFEIAHTLNSRPLTHVSLDPRDNEALTPNHFLIGSSSGDVILGNYQLKDICLRKQYQLTQAFADAFWKRWIREYLPDLIPRKKWTESEDPLVPGDIVLIIDLQAPRNCWRRGTVTRVFPGSDKQVRVAEVRTSNGTFTRPTRKLIKLLGLDEVQN